MKKKNEYLVITLLTVVLLVVLFVGWEKIKAERIVNQKISLEYNEMREQRGLRINELKHSIESDIPGIVAYGDSLTAGAGGDGVTYPLVLQQLMQDNIYEIPVVNSGVGGEDTNTIMGRAGSVPFVVNAFMIPEDKSKVAIELSSSNGSAVGPLVQGDGGINPVMINGVEGIISFEQDSSSSNNSKYYFQRSTKGEQVEVSNGSTVEIANISEFNNYIPIVFMGQNGGYSGNQDLINQINSILNMDKSNDKFLVLGLTTSSAEDRADLEYAMESKFGNRYLNLRKYIVENGLEQSGLEATSEDLAAIEIGAVPPSLLLTDGVHFNSSGYTVIGNAVYERMQELGYFENVLNIANELNSM